MITLHPARHLLRATDLADARYALALVERLPACAEALRRLALRR